ncbi:MAG: alpha-2-macroglobulin, partial [Bacteroidetes bacterium]
VYVRSAAFSDGEEGFWPVLSNRVLVTESQPIFVPGGKTKSFTLRGLAESSTTPLHHQLTFDMVANPVWEVIKALPYLREYPYDCTEQVMNRWFANALALHIASTQPQLAAYYASWAKDSTALQSPLAQHEAHKTALLSETPWVKDALAEGAQRQQIRELFDRETRLAEQQNDWQTLLQRQRPDGSFSWFPGGPDNLYMTQYVVEQFTRLQQLTANEQQDDAFVRSALRYLDEQMAKRYRDLAKNDNLEGDHFDPTIAQYLYVRTSYPTNPLAQEPQIYQYWLAQAGKYWPQQPLQSQAYAAIALKRAQQTDIAASIFQSFRERSRYEEDLGRYWPHPQGWHWYQHPLETHCLLMEAYRELGGTPQEQDELRLWLLRHKEANRWETTKATAAAIHALLQDGSDWQADHKP